MLFAFSFLLASCGKHESASSERVTFDREGLSDSISKIRQDLGWVVEAFSESSSFDGKRYITKYRKEQDAFYVYYEMDSDKTTAYNLCFIGRRDQLEKLSQSDATATRDLMHALREELPWLDEKATFLSDIDVVESGLSARLQP